MCQPKVLMGKLYDDEYLHYEGRPVDHHGLPRFDYAKTVFAERQPKTYQSKIKFKRKRRTNHSNRNDVFAKLDSASTLFEVLVLKTESTIPYSSVFIQLDCAYWNAEKEQKLRSKMGE